MKMINVLAYLLFAVVGTTFPAAAQVTVNVKVDCGAKGDGVTNDTAAFQDAAQRLQSSHGGTLTIPSGVYIVGKQYHTAGEVPYYQTQPIFSVSNLSNLLVEGNNATIRLADGMRHGSFDPDTGQVYNPQLPFTDPRYHVTAGDILAVSNSSHVTIRNLKLDGNASHLQLGGQWGDSGRQGNASGLFLLGNTDVQVSRVQSRNNGLDGIMVGYYGLTPSSPTTLHTFSDCTFENNARQGMSWIGGLGLRAYRCKFNGTGRVLNGGQPLASSPGAGLDIEAEDSVIRDGYFENCEFNDNVGPGVIADSGDGGYTTFKSCTFWGTTTWSAWSNKPGLKYEDCKFYGSVVRAFGSSNTILATRWTRCQFEDKPYTNGLVYRQNSASPLVEFNGDLQNVAFDNCRFTANTCKSIWIGNSAATPVQFSSCTWTYKKSNLDDGDFMALFYGVKFTGGMFTEQFPAGTNKNWYLAVNTVTLTPSNPTFVSGPRVHWASPTGPTGFITQ